MSGLSSSEVESLSRLYFYAHTISTLTFGIYLVLTIISTGLWLRRGRRRMSRSVAYSALMSVVTLAWFCVNTMNSEVGVIDILIAPPNLPATSYYCTTLNVLDEALMSAVFIGSDILLIYRLYIIYERNWFVTAVPLATWVALVGISIVVDLACTPAVPNFSIYVRVAQAYYILPFVPNLMCTVLIIGKLVWHQRLLRKCGIHANHSSYWLLTTCIAEAGLVYSMVGIVHCVLWWRHVEAYNITEALYIASAYLCEAHIILRLALGVELVPKRHLSNVPVVGSPTAFDMRVLYASTTDAESASKLGTR